MADCDHMDTSADRTRQRLPVGILEPFAAALPHRAPLDYEGAAGYLNITVRHLRELVYRREIPHAKVGRLVRFLPNDLDAWLAAHRRAA
jgi:excisionase family DNA binding protein